ncbi:NAD(P)-dependent oxidoreductase [Natrialbaceae archaeon GCM10025810]|uniref:NAD(P)-dependent oxidoreductase n=1 Tax=Halovalidus salilacus TaxID=3075124 RepID=UPI0036183E71
MKLVIFGATGRTGVPLVERALEHGHEVVAFARDGAGLPTSIRTHERVAVVEGDAYAGEGIETAIGGAGSGDDPVDAAVSVLGQTSSGPDDLLTVAGEHVFAAMDEHGVDRFVTLVGAGVREDGESVSLGGRAMGALLSLLASEVLEDAERHVEAVRASDVRWTVVRAPRLIDGDPADAVRHGTDLRLGLRDAVSRANVAAFILYCLEDDLYVREIPKLTGR